MKRAIFILAALIIIIILSIFISKYLFYKKIDNEIKKLSREGSETQSESFHFSDLEGLPEPVQRYFRYALKDGQEYIKFARLKQIGEFRMKENQPWMPIKAEQYFSTQNPAFLWQVHLKMNPLIWIDGRDMYYQGRGNMLIKILSTINVVNATGREMDISSLIRFLAEAVWFPTALLPSEHIEWKVIDSNSAQVIIKDGEYTASGIYTFNESGEIIKFVSNDRYMEVNGKYFKEKWSGYFRNYREFNGMKIPTEGEVEWNLPDKDLPYAKLKITDIQYNIFSKF